MRITSIEPQQRNPTRRNLYVDGVFALGISPETLLRFGLRKGDDVTQDILDSVSKTEELVNAKAAALRYLGVRPRTEREIRDKLRDKEFGDEEIAKTIRELMAAGLVNDHDFACMYIRDQMLKRPAGKMLLMKKLLLLGVEKSVIEQAIKETLDVEGLEQTALQLAREFGRKAKALRKSDSAYKLRNRTASFLGRRGFAWDTIQSALKTLFPSEPEQSNDHAE